MELSSPRTSRIFFYIIMATALAFAILILILESQEIDFMTWLPSDHRHTEMGLYCPGCGGTRAFFAFFRGEWLTSLWYHAAVLPTLLALIVFCISHIVNIVTRGRVHALRLHAWHLYTVLGLIIVQWLGKFVYLGVTGIKPI